MAIWFNRSTTISHHYLKKRISFWENLGHSFHTNIYSPTNSIGENCRNPTPFFCESKALFGSRRFKSIKTGGEEDLQQDINGDHQNQGQDFPGGRIRFTSAMNFNSEFPMKRVPCYRVLDDNGHPIMHSGFRQVSKDDALKMYSSMVTLQTMDNIFYEAQRQGRISFYLTSYGEEAINIASAAALTQDDIVLPQYREHGVLLWRGFTLQEFANQCFGNKADYGKGGKCQFIMGPVHSITSMFHHRSLLSFLKLWVLLILSKWIERMHAPSLILGMVAAVREISTLV
ncbi:hypothetical protein HYC85_020054 [Camellia sinensis]|uniref:Dehydrogenase E1 component domain-containing protein n=1 Tax=Camellia sinensis TaxID=4442 RepID=A0A7J7GNP2_CAMSI|nr:hypothetical protein HYC85_020054 [Camellia sinensis]